MSNFTIPQFEKLAKNSVPAAKKSFLKNLSAIPKIGMLLLFLVVIPFSASAQTQEDLRGNSEYTPGQCPANDIVILGASLDTGDPCNSCAPGDTVTADLLITINHGTNSANRYLGVFADITETLPDGTATTSGVALCSGPVLKDSEETGDQQVLNYGQITFTCGSSLKLSDILLVWTAANGECPVTPANNPNGKYCYDNPVIDIVPPLNAVVEAECGDGNTGNYDLTVTGGVGPFTYLWSNGATSEDLTNVTLGAYTVTVTDTGNTDEFGANCTVQGSGDFNGPCCEFFATCNLNDAEQVIEGCDETALPPLLTASQVFTNITDLPCGDLVLISNDVPSGTLCGPDGLTVERTYTLFDDLNDDQILNGLEESVTCVQNFRIEDNTAPTVDNAVGSADATLECSDTAGIDAALAFAPTFMDNCTDAGDITISLASDDTTPDATCANAYVRVRTWTGDDGCGNVSAVFTQTITVEDNTAPTVDNAVGSADATLECSDTAGIDAALAFAPTFMDNCTDAGDITISLASDDTTPDATCANAYVRVRTWTGDDGCGNVSAVFTQTITVEDNTAPTVDNAVGSADATLECSDTAGIDAALAFAPTFMDNCTDAGDITISLASDDTTPDATCANAYVRVRTWTGDDGCGNVSAVFTQTITVEDNTAPTVDNAVGSADATLECSDTAGIDAALAFAPTFMDNCTDAGDITISLASDDTTPDATCANAYVRVRTWTGDDGCGNVSAVFTQTITVEDNTAPTVDNAVGSADATLECSDTAGIDAALAFAPTFMDNCTDAGDITISLASDDTTPDATCANAYVRVRTWTGDDGCGNVSAVFTQTITVEDNTAPTVDNAVGSADATLECSDTAGIDAALAFAPTFMDNCTDAGDITISLASDDTTPDATCANAYVRVRTWTGDDGCGNVSAVFTQTITVEDNTAPTVDNAVGSADATLECSDTAGIDAALAFAPTFMDNCTDAGDITISLASDDTTPDATCANAYVRVRTWTGDDGCGNVSAVFTQTITVEDNTAPTVDNAVGSADATLECSDTAGIDAALAFAPTFMDNCTDAGDITISLASDDTTPDATCANAYVRVRTWTGDDGCGNVSAVFTQTITVEDNTAPTVDNAVGSADATLECSDTAGIDAALAFAPTFMDNCTDAGDITISLASDDTTPDATCANAYVRVRTWTGDDGCGNVSAVFTQTITVEDNTAPTVDNAVGSADATLECSDTAGIDAALAFAPTFMDNCTDAGDITISLASDDTTPDATCANAYVRVRTWTGDDGCGNVSAVFTQTITVEDNTAPTVDNAVGSADATLECSDTAGIDAALAFAPTFMDNCTDAGDITISLASDDTTPDATCANAYVRVRTWTGDDGCGNVSAVFTQTITVEDNTAPTVDNAVGSADATLECSDTAGIDAALAFAPTFMDNCTDAGDITISLASDDTTPDATCANAYVRVRTWTGDDGCGNVSAVFTQTITVEDNTAPTVDNAVGSADATLECSDTAGIDAALAFAPTFMDNCTDAGDITISLASDDTTPDATCANAYVRVRTWTGDDGCGNVSAVFTQTITVEDNTAPTVDNAVGSADATLECSDTAGIDAALAFAPTFMDNCTDAGDITISLASDDTTPDATCANAYVRVRTWTGDDGCGNVSAVFTQTITVEDNTAPTVDNAVGSADATLECSDTAGIDAALAFAPTFMDNCTDAGDITISLASDDTTPDATCANAYVRVRTWTGDDGCGNVSAVFTQTITVEDNTAPTVDNAVGSADATLECSDTAGIDAALAFAPTFMDNCTDAGDITISLASDDTTPDATCANAYVRVRTWTGDDGCGNVSAVFTQTITVEDNTAPTVDNAVGSADATLECSDTAGIDAALAFAPTFMDNCTDAGDITISLASDDTTPDATCANAYVRVRTWTGDDGCGNVSAVFTQTITVEDNTAPTVDNAVGSADATLECSDTAGIDAALAFAPTFMDNCTDAGDITISLASDDTTPDATCANAYVRVRTWTGDDGCGNVSAVFTQTITVEDNTAPTVDNAVGSADATLECSDTAGIDAALAFAPTFMDNCTDAGDITISLASDDTTPDATCANAYVRVRTWTGDDGCGNVSAVFTQTITVEDNTAPTVDNAVGSADATLECSDTAGIDAALAFAPTFMDNCTDAGDITISLASDDTTPDATCANAYVRVRTWTGDDGCGNVSAVFTQTITVEDNTAPTVDNAVGSADATLECSDTAGIDAALAFAPTFMDNCTDAGDITISLASDDTTPDATCANAYVRVRTWTGDDGCGNVSAVFTQTITVEDNTAPEITGGSDLILKCDDENNQDLIDAWLLANGGAIGEDACGEVTWTNDYSGIDDACGAMGETTVTFTATDECGNPNDVVLNIFVASVDIVKTFTADSVIAGGAESTFTLTVTNDGTAPLSNVVVEDVVDGRLTVTNVSCGAISQNISCTIPTLGVGYTEVITVTFEVDSAVPEANGVEGDGEPGLNDEPNVQNDATASSILNNDPDCVVKDEASDTIDIEVDINLSIVKTFDPADAEAPQGTLQSFTIMISNSGPSDAVDVSVTDTVEDILEVTDVNVTSGSGVCIDDNGQEVDCTVQVPAGQSVVVTVDYLTAPFFDNSGSPYGTLPGDDFIFIFENGDRLEGSTDGGPVFLNGDDITADVTIVNSLTRNEITFDPPGPDPAFTMHLSCSDPFTGGWGQSAGPVEGVDTNWKIAFFTIGRYNPQGFLKSCGNVVNDFVVPNTADATGSDTVDGTNTVVSEEVTVTVGPGITLDRLQTKGKRLTVRLTNYTGEPKMIEDVTAEWLESNGDLKKVWLTYGNVSNVIWQGSDDPTDALLNAFSAGWNGGTLFPGEAILRFDFANKVADTGYTIRVNFTDGTFLDISVGGDENQSASSTAEATTVKVTDASEIPVDVTTVEAYPLPFGNRLNLQMEIAYEAIVNVQLFDMDGRLVLNLGNHAVVPGTNTLEFRIDDRIPEAILILKIDTGKEIISKTVLSRK